MPCTRAAGCHSPPAMHSASRGREASMTAPGGGTLAIRDERILKLEGELDISSAAQLPDAVDRIASSGGSALVIELSGLEFIDGSALAAAARGRCAVGGRELVLIPGPPQVQRAFEGSGLIDVLHFRGPRAGGSER